MADEHTDQLINEWLDRKAQMEKDKSDLDDLEAAIKLRLEQLGTDRASLTGLPSIGVKLKAGANTWKDAKAAQLLTPEQQAMIAEPKMSGRKADALVTAGILPAELVALCRERNKPSLDRL